MKKYKNNYILMIIAFFLLIVSIFTVFWFSSDSFNLKTPEIIGKAILTIDFGNGKKRAFEGEIIKGETLVDVLSQSSKAGGFSYELNEGSEIVLFIDASYKEKNFLKNNDKSWRWYLHDKKIDRSPSEIAPKNGDDILIKYE